MTWMLEAIRFPLVHTFIKLKFYKLCEYSYDILYTSCNTSEVVFVCVCACAHGVCRLVREVDGFKAHISELTMCLRLMFGCSHNRPERCVPADLHCLPSVVLHL